MRDHGLTEDLAVPLETDADRDLLTRVAHAGRLPAGLHRPSDVGKGVDQLRRLFAARRIDDAVKALRQGQRRLALLVWVAEQPLLRNDRHSRAQAQEERGDPRSV